jgi:hypothetical protein
MQQLPTYITGYWGKAQPTHADYGIRSRTMQRIVTAQGNRTQNTSSLRTR